MEYLSHHSDSHTAWLASPQRRAGGSVVYEYTATGLRVAGGRAPIGAPRGTARSTASTAPDIAAVEVPWREVPLDARTVAEYVAGLCARDLFGVYDQIKVRWYRYARADESSTLRVGAWRGFYRTGGWDEIWLRQTDDYRQLARTTAHEVLHAHQDRFNRYATDRETEASEGEARAYAESVVSRLYVGADAQTGRIFVSRD